MSIKQDPSKEPLTPPAEPPWGKAEPEGKTANVVQFVLADRTVSFPVKAIKRWELVGGDPERLLITIEKELVSVEGKALGLLRDALNESRLQIVRINGARPSARPGPVVRRIAIESA
jgi:hypothetical protein